MASTNINIRTDSELKTKAQVILADLGLDMTTAINIFLKQVVYKKALPFTIDKSSNQVKKARSTIKGFLKDKVWMANDFNAPIEDMHEYM